MKWKSDAEPPTGFPYVEVNRGLYRCGGNVFLMFERTVQVGGLPEHQERLRAPGYSGQRGEVRGCEDAYEVIR